MRRFVQMIATSLAATVLLAACSSTPAETTAPPETTLPIVETTVPPETTVPETTESDELSLKHGELLNVTINEIDDIAVIKAKIEPSYSNRATIVQNYLNVCDLIQNHGFDQYGEVQYWAVADMTDGSESKVISFTVGADLIDLIAADDGFVENNLGDYDIDLWLHNSLK